MGIEIVWCEVIAWEVMLVWCGACGMYVIARVKEGQVRVKNMMCSGLWGGGGVVSESEVTKPITELNEHRS